MTRSALLALGLTLAAASLGIAADGDAVLGLWATDPDGEGGQARVEIAKDATGYHGTIVWLEKPLYGPDDDDGVPGEAKEDRNNPDPELRNRPIIGLRIVDGFSYDGKGEWRGGTIYDPDNGKTYKCKMRLSGDQVLKVRGYIGFSLLGRTTEWTRVAASSAAPAGEQ